ncbi:PilC/PilY family type IV pilus protein [Xenophilus arseniciresistens]|uniref:PilC/PilY family type IV pilus protein n=1 Tax=Xenophilus arseniciresistens TaxID=1283306 RepID=A0AAE3SY69_9BURK|nr:PilC/PilY family type IV pilus protein [Xenophilus arseniciresistens]MDA7415205.1 PilC/PilY family type IV pilus protein [Xenophilus arseniciresistens]
MNTMNQAPVPTAAKARRARLNLQLSTVGLVAAWFAAALPGADAVAATAPSQAPLYSAVPGAKPNLMFVLDNSGSMGFVYQDSYSVNDKCKSTNDWGCRDKYGWYSMRSSSVNTQYYNPAITYIARVNSNGVPLNNPTLMVDNQASSDGSPYSPTDSAHTTVAAATGKKFTYLQCAGSNCSSSSSRTEVTINYPVGSTPVNLPPGHKRTECDKTTNTCTPDQERQNIVNWYQWYRTRTLAISTALGQAMQNYQNKFRVGYVQYNIGGAAATNIIRGVRYFKDEDTSSKNWKTQFYNWIYGISPNGGTPSHNALSLAANYYNGTGKSTYGNPWKNDPTSTADTTSEDLSCRRAYSIVLSDGAWNAGTAPSDVTKYASTQGTNYSGTPSGTPATLQFNPSGATGWDSTNLKTKLAARNLYIPYSDGGASSKGFADLTARYFWRSDFSNLDNNVPVIEGQHNPTFWQNMTTFTIGWGLTPSGDSGTANGLKWAQIDQYNNDWLAGRAVTRPNWATGDLNAGSTPADDARRVDDFIRAGFTGGGRAYSVYSGEDVRRALDNALGGMVGSGNDAGVAVSGNSGEFQTLENQYKYTTEYQTADNSGDIKAFQLNADGGYKVDATTNKPIVAWSANEKMPVVETRKIFALSGYDAATRGTAATRWELNSNTTLTSLPADFKALLNSNNLQKDDNTFIRYMLGEDALADKTGAVYRARKQPIGASVNSPPVFVGGRIDMGYETFGSVNGKDKYGTYKTTKSSLPPTIFAATNNGKVHVLNAAKDDNVLTGFAAGAELASFMPKGAMASQVDLANPNFRFRYTLDGPLVEHDLYDATKWRQLVFGTGGRAGSFMYGLESPMNTSNRIPTQDSFLWELDNKTTGYADLAHVTNNPTAGQLDDGTWVMLTGSGHYAGAGRQLGLYVVEAFTGKRKAFIPLPEEYGAGDTANGGNRGLGGVVAVRDATRRIVAAYAGDANGNLWRFDLRSSKFAVSFGRPLFTTPGGKSQPIYAAPAWQTHPGDGGNCTYSTESQCGAIVVVGTGILLDEDDLATPARKQAIYGIWDQTPIGGDDKGDRVAVADLVEQTIDLASAVTGQGRAEAGKTFYTVSSNPVDWKKQRGWRLSLGMIRYPGAMTDGERVVGDLSNLGSSVMITSFLPEDRNLGIESCTATGSLPNIIYVLDALTGKNKRSFDVDSNGTFEPYSIVSIPSGGFTRGNVTSRNLIGLPNEGRPDGKPPVDCTNETGYVTGPGSTQKAGDGCVPKGWRRSWRSVVQPPF